MTRTRRIRRIVTLATLALTAVIAPNQLTAQAASAPAPNEAARSRTDSAAVVATVGRFHAALAAGDSSGALALLAADAIILESGGIETRDEYRSHHLPGDIAYARSSKSTRGPLHVTVRGDVAWASSTSTTTREGRNGVVNSSGAELVVLIRAGAEWRISAIHWSSRTIRPPAD